MFIVAHKVAASTGSVNDALTNSFTQALKGRRSCSPNATVLTPQHIGIYIRGLYVAWSRSPRDSDVAKLIESFILVQVR